MFSGITQRMLVSPAKLATYPKAASTLLCGFVVAHLLSTLFLTKGEDETRKRADNDVYGTLNCMRDIQAESQRVDV